jgi:hypothetical protein
MINFHFSVYPPIENSFCRPKEYFFKHWHITKNKAMEVQLNRMGDDILCIDLKYTVTGDHAGVSIHLGLFGHNFMFDIYDRRHWDYDRGCWINNPQDRGS